MGKRSHILLALCILAFLGATQASGNPAEGSGMREVAVHAGKPAGRIRSLIGVNRGPFAWPREAGGEIISLVESFRRFGIDFIRNHDFYGPTDWHVIFPRWEADVTAPASYDFRSSDERIRAIAENGFGCFNCWKRQSAWLPPAATNWATTWSPAVPPAVTGCKS